mmetsp:Transcript_13545/g.39536  ORF Transcript_13545/g.39536 Transcript_13545/m.39536 type:complete len:231 (-) Transcript_13545:45-737(-)
MPRSVAPQAEGGGPGDVEGLPLQGIPLDQLPPLPKRGDGYASEPISGICLVSVLSTALVAATYGAVAFGRGQRTLSGVLVTKLIWTEALTAVLCTAYLLLAQAGVIRRSASTCYPMPAEVEQCLRSSGSLVELGNVPGPAGSPTLGTYCVRCLVWRPPKERDSSHHCSICQRCVVGFDHHCDVFGRCIVRANMTCFMTLIGMMCTGMLTLLVAVVSNAEVVTVEEHEGGT